MFTLCFQRIYLFVCLCVDVSGCVKKTSPADPASASPTATDSKADLGG